MRRTAAQLGAQNVENEMFMSHSQYKVRHFVITGCGKVSNQLSPRWWAFRADPSLDYTNSRFQLLPPKNAGRPEIASSDGRQLYRLKELGSTRSGFSLTGGKGDHDRFRFRSGDPRLPRQPDGGRRRWCWRAALSVALRYLPGLDRRARCHLASRWGPFSLREQRRHQSGDPQSTGDGF